MRVKRIRFRHVGPFGAQGVTLDDFTPGLNVVCETNEFGKSTVLKALEMVLFKPFSSADKQVKSLQTAISDMGPTGEITFESDGVEYCFSKTFLKNKGACLQDNKTGEVIAYCAPIDIMAARRDCFGCAKGHPWKGLQMTGKSLRA